MNRRDLLAAAAVLPVALPAVATEGKPIPPHDEVRAILQQSAEQWTAGDLEGFCAHYGDDAIFLSPTGRTDGRQAVYQRYRKKYVDKRGMGALALEVLHVVADGTAASVAMKWRLTFEGKPPAEGFSVVGLERRNDLWKIVHDASM
jgi:ketosteroid isomerase-like protein